YAELSGQNPKTGRRTIGFAEPTHAVTGRLDRSLPDSTNRLRQWNPVVSTYCAGKLLIVPIPIGASCIFRRLLQLILGDHYLIAAKIDVVLERRPWQRVIIITDSEKAAEAQNSIGDFAANLFDHHPLNRSDFLTVGPKHRRSLHLIALDKADCFLRFQEHGCPPCFLQRTAIGRTFRRARAARRTLFRQPARRGLLHVWRAESAVCRSVFL